MKITKSLISLCIFPKIVLQFSQLKNFMAQEIERQFVVNTEHEDWLTIRDNLPAEKIVQATIHRGDGNKLRVRLIENLQTGKQTGSFAFKVVQKSGKSEPNIRDEYEWDVPPHVAHYIMIGHPEVVKIRRKYLHND